MILLDTNVVSELMRPRPSPAVTAWIAAQSAANVYLSVITEAELCFGAAILPPGRRREMLGLAIEKLLRGVFARRILPFDSEAARMYAVVAASRRAIGLTIDHADCQVAAIARCHEAAVATRNVRHFEHCGIEVIDPWSA